MLHYLFIASMVPFLKSPHDVQCYACYCLCSNTPATRSLRNNSTSQSGCSFKSFLSWIPELRISTLLQIHSAVAMTIAQSPGKSDRCLFRARTLASSSWLCCVIFSFCLHVLALFWCQDSFLIYTYTHTPHTHISAKIVWFPVLHVRILTNI